ncbi:MAG: hypothetical protein Q9214_001316 [Letrouitia sp. 1 TL-2023]
MAKKDPKPAPKQTQQLNKKKKKKDSQQQPAQLFPPNEENPVKPKSKPVLNPKLESEDQKLQKRQDWDGAIKSLQYKAHNCLAKNPPPKKLLTLVGGFLNSYGFDSACRLFRQQCNARNRFDGWDNVLGEKLPKDHPNLLQIYEEWEINDRATKLLTHGDGLKKTKESKDKNFHQEKVDTDYTSSSGITTSGDDSNSSSDGDINADSNVEMKDETLKSAKGAKGAKDKKKSASTSSSSSSFSSSSSSSSDSDADDEKEPVDDRTTASKPTVSGLLQGPKKRSDAAKATIELLAKKSDKPTEQSKRAAEPTSSSSSSAASKSDSDSSSSSTSSVASKLVDNLTETKRTSKIVEGVDDPKSTNFDRSTKRTKSLGKQIKIKKASKAAMSTSSDDSSSSSIDSDVPAKQADTKSKSKPEPRSKPEPKSKPKATFKKASISQTGPSSSSPWSDSDSSSSSSISDSNPSPKAAKASIDSNLTKTSSDSTATLIADSPPPPPSGPPVQTRKRTHSPSAHVAIKKAKTQNFQRVPADTVIDKGFESNRYRSYDYADRAHKNLRAVKGNAFIKEKNKQKRRNYRGGMIDIEGGRAIKFD